MFQPTPLLRRVLLADALISGGMALLLIVAAGVLAPILGLPEALLRGAGVLLVPFVAFVGTLASKASLSRTAVWAVVLVNALWVVDSAMLLVAGWVQPTVLGYAFVGFQAVTVAAFAELQYVGLRRSGGIAAS